MYVCPCIIYEIDERYPLDATIYYYKQLYMFRASICPSSGVLDCILIILLHMVSSTRCCGWGSEEPVCSLVHWFKFCIRLLGNVRNTLPNHMVQQSRRSAFSTVTQWKPQHCSYIVGNIFLSDFFIVPVNCVFLTHDGFSKKEWWDEILHNIWMSVSVNTWLNYLKKVKGNKNIFQY